MSTKKGEKAPEQSLAVVQDQLPDYLRGTEGRSARGREEVQADDLVIPRLEICQALSPCRKRNDPAFIDGIAEGDMYNNITRDIYGTSVILIPVAYRKEWLIWKDRQKGGGFRGAFATEAEAEAELANIEDGADCQVIDTPQMFCLLVHPNGRAEEIVVSMSKSKAKVSRAWNSLIRMTDMDSFARAYNCSTVSEKNAKNQDYFNFTIKPAGYPSQELYKRAEGLYEAITSGRVRADRTEEAAEAESRDF